jgi:hypothetical protein
MCCPNRSILHPRESNESFIGDSLKFIAVMLVSMALQYVLKRLHEQHLQVTHARTQPGGTGSSPAERKA